MQEVVTLPTGRAVKAAELAEAAPYSREWLAKIAGEELKLTMSPAMAWGELEGPDQGCRSLVTHWPFQIAHAGRLPSAPTCLALLALETGISVEQAAKSLVELERNGLVVWSNDHWVYVLLPPVSEVTDQYHNGDITSDQAWDAIGALMPSTAAERAARRWHPAQVIARFLDEASEQPQGTPQHNPTPTPTP